MPSLTGYVDDEQEETIDRLIDEGRFEDRSEFVQEAVSYFLYNKY